MIYQTYVPQSLLSQFIEFFWLREGEHSSAVQTRLLPMGTIELVINLHEDSIPLFNRQSRVQCGSTNGIMLCGPHSENFIVQVDRQISVMGIHFRPGGGTAFFKLPASELHNETISLDQLWQGHAAELRDRLLEKPLDNRFPVLEQFLMQMLQPPAPYPAVDFALQQFQRSTLPTVSAVTDRIGFSTRHFNQLFRDRVGLTPKLFCRIQRFQQVLNLLSGKTQVDWMDIVFTCGYFDQAHLIHEFRAFADCTPTEYLSQRGFHPCHVELSPLSIK
jgi:AraC-like DNA-binding protein